MNTRRENRLEELGRVDAEKAYTSKGKRNLREEKSRIRKELKEGGPTYKRKRVQKRTAGPMQSPPKRRKFQPDPRQKQQGPKRLGRGISPRQMDTTNYQDLMDQYKKHKRDKFRKDLQDYTKDRKPGSPPRIEEPRLPRKKDRIMTPLRVKKRGGGLSQAQQHYVQHGYGPHKSSGKVLKGKKIGIQIK